MNTITRPTRHRYGLTDRPSAITRWVNIITIGPEFARLEAERNNPGFTAHEAYDMDDATFQAAYPRSGMQVWRVELWKN